MGMPPYMIAGIAGSIKQREEERKPLDEILGRINDLLHRDGTILNFNISSSIEDVLENEELELSQEILSNMNKIRINEKQYSKVPRIHVRDFFSREGLKTIYSQHRIEKNITERYVRNARNLKNNILDFYKTF